MLRIIIFLLCWFFSVNCFSQDQIITGQVTYSVFPLSGAKIKVIGKGIETKSDSIGKFSINATIGDSLLIELSDFKPSKVEIKNMDYLKIKLSFVVPLNPKIKAEFPGGSTEFNAYLIRGLRKIGKSKLHGKVFVSFIIDTTGLVMPRYTSIIRKPKEMEGSAINDYLKKVVKVINNSPAWKPAYMDGKKARGSFTIPIEI